jgi:hypothetical protein
VAAKRQKIKNYYFNLVIIGYIYLYLVQFSDRHLLWVFVCFTVFFGTSIPEINHYELELKDTIHLSRQPALPIGKTGWRPVTGLNWPRKLAQ